MKSIHAETEEKKKNAGVSKFRHRCFLFLQRPSCTLETHVSAPARSPTPFYAHTGELIDSDVRESRARIENVADGLLLTTLLLLLSSWRSPFVLYAELQAVAYCLVRPPQWHRYLCYCGILGGAKWKGSFLKKKQKNNDNPIIGWNLQQLCCTHARQQNFDTVLKYLLGVPNLHAIVDTSSWQGSCLPSLFCLTYIFPSRFLTTLALFVTARPDPFGLLVSSFWA